MDFLDKTYTIKFDPLLLAIITLFIVLLGISYYLLKRKQKTKQAKTGFLGKPLYQLGMLIVVLASMFAGVYYFSGVETQLITEAKKEVKTEIYYQVVARNDNLYTVQFKAIPSVDGKEWGKADDKFDLLWNIKPNDVTQLKGQKNIDYFESSKSSMSPSSFVITLMPGEYKVEVLVVYNDETYKSTKSIIIQ